jgi:hypothetical protein
MRRHLVLIPAVVAALASTLVAQQSNPVALANTPVPAGQRIAYGSDPLQFGELRLPAGSGPHPVVVAVHGGCWLAQLGDLDPRAVAMDNMRPFAEALTQAGIATWNIEYRRLGHDGGGWPGTFRDIAAATDFLRTLAREHPLDLTRVVAVGHSSGGHFAMWLGGRPGIAAGSELHTPEPLRLRGVINLDGPGDLKATIPLERQICGAPVVTDLMGGSPEDHPNRYRAASPVELLPFGIPQAYFAGRMFGAQLAPYEAAATAAGDTVQAISLPDAGHFVFIDPKSDVWPDVLQRIRHLLGMKPVAPSPDDPRPRLDLVRRGPASCSGH